MTRTGKARHGAVGMMSRDRKDPKTSKGEKQEAAFTFSLQLAQQYQGPGSYLRFLHLNDPGGRDNHSSMSPQGAGFLNVVQHEAGHLIVELKRKTGQ